MRTRGHLTTTSVSTPYLCHVLSRYGELDLAYQLLNRQEPPSWLAPVTRGATTTPSFDHSAYGAIGEWMYRVVAGLEIDPDDPGYRHVLVQPQPGGGLSSAEAGLETPYGEASSAWALLDEGRFSVSAVVPPNARGTIRLPNATLAEVTESDAPVTSAGGIRTVTQEDGAVVVEVGSGRYRFDYAAGDLVNRLRPGADTTGFREESLQGQNGDPSK